MIGKFFIDFGRDGTKTRGKRQFAGGRIMHRSHARRLSMVSFRNQRSNANTVSCGSVVVNEIVECGSDERAGCGVTVNTGMHGQQMSAIIRLLAEAISAGRQKFGDTIPILQTVE